MFANTYITGFVKHGNEEIPLTPDHEKVHVTHNTVFTDDETIYFVTDYESEYAYLAKFDLNSRKFETVLQIEEESISSLKWDKDRKQFYVVTEKGVIVIFSYSFKRSTSFQSSAVVADLPAKISNSIGSLTIGIPSSLKFSLGSF